MLWTKIVGWVALVLGIIGIVQSLMGTWNMMQMLSDPESHISHDAKKRFLNTWLVTVLLLILAVLFLYLG